MELAERVRLNAENQRADVEGKLMLLQEKERQIAQVLSIFHQQRVIILIIIIIIIIIIKININIIIIRSLLTIPTNRRVDL